MQILLSAWFRGAVAVTLVALVATLTASPANSTLPGGVSAAGSSAPVQSAKLLMHPQLAQPGKSKRSAGSARSSMTAVFRPIRPGRKVVLQARRGGRWVNVATRQQNRRGIAEFNAAYRKNGQFQTYRARAVRYASLGRITSSKVSTGRWGRADFTDQFSGRGIGDAWSHRYQDFGATPSRKCSMTGAKRAARVRQGTLRLRVLFDKGPNPERRPKCRTPNGRFQWRANGHISTAGHHSFRYGYAAARIRFQPRAGQHGAFWMQPVSNADVGRGPGSEIDVIEWFGNRKNNDTELTSFVYHRGTKIGGFIKDTGRYGNRWAKMYHVFSVEWTPKRYVFRIDGKETFRTGRGVSHRPEFLILSLLSSDYELPLLGKGNLPQTMHVDWARFWER